MKIQFSQISQMTPEQVVEIVKGVDKKTWIRLAIGAVVLGVLFYFLIYPAWIKRFEIRAKAQASKAQITQTNALFRKRPELIKIKEESQSFIKDSKERMYTPSEASLLLGVISKMANDSKVAIVASKPRPFEGKLPAPFDTQYEASLYDVTVEGGYHAVGDFVSRLESNPKILRIQSFNIRQKEKSDKVHLADFTLSAVSQKAPAPAPVQK